MIREALIKERGRNRHINKQILPVVKSDDDDPLADQVLGSVQVCVAGAEREAASVHKHQDRKAGGVVGVLAGLRQRFPGHVDVGVDARLAHAALVGLQALVHHVGLRADRALRRRVELLSPRV